MHLLTNRVFQINLFALFIFTDAVPESLLFAVFATVGPFFPRAPLRPQPIFFRSRKFALPKERRIFFCRLNGAVRWCGLVRVVIDWSVLIGPRHFPDPIELRSDFGIESREAFPPATYAPGHYPVEHGLLVLDANQGTARIALACIDALVRQTVSVPIRMSRTKFSGKIQLVLFVVAVSQAVVAREHV